MLISQAREEYLRWLVTTKDLSPHTLRAYDGDLATLERHVGQDATVTGLNQDCLIAFIDAQRAVGLSPRSLKRRACGIRGFCRWLLLHDLLDSDPWLGATVPAARSRRLPHYLPSHELERLLSFLVDAAHVREHPGSAALLERPYEATNLLAVALMLATGMRVGEVVEARNADIDLREQSLRILGKGRRERQVFLTNEWITNLTRAYVETRRALGVTHPQLLFNIHKAPLTPAALRTRLAKAAQEAGLITRLTPHVLRHTAATQLIEAGVDIRYIQRLLGHASLSTTEIYTHVSDGALRRVVSDADVLARLLR